MKKSSEYYVEVETAGTLTRGYSLVDINNRSGKKPNVRVCEAVDRPLFKKTLLEVLQAIK